VQDGVWRSERVLPEGWAKLVSTPAPAWQKPEYGGLFWLNRTREWPVPESAYLMIGADGQKVFVVPSHDLVVVRMGHSRGGAVYAKSLKAALELVMRAVEAKSP
jgi:CubicO group peptidase (beta-lactamase class C family)